MSAKNRTPVGNSSSYRKSMPPKDLVFDYKNPSSLRRYLTEEYKIVPRRISGLNAIQQRDLTKAVKRAKILALIPFTANHDLSSQMY